jgi:hypothetical protein
MAVWEFKFTLYPQEQLIAEFGCIPEVILDDAAPMGHEPVYLGDDHERPPGRWKGRDMDAICIEAAKLLPESVHWADGARLFRQGDNHRIEVWEDDVDARIDCRIVEIAFLEALIETIKRLDAVICLSENGTIIMNDVPSIVSAIKASWAWKFVGDPGGTLTEIGRLHDEKAKQANMTDKNKDNP